MPRAPCPCTATLLPRIAHPATATLISSAMDFCASQGSAPSGSRFPHVAVVVTQVSAKPPVPLGDISEFFRLGISPLAAGVPTIAPGIMMGGDPATNRGPGRRRAPASIAYRGNLEEVPRAKVAHSGRRPRRELQTNLRHPHGQITHRPRRCTGSPDPRRIIRVQCGPVQNSIIPGIERADQPLNLIGPGSLRRFCPGRRRAPIPRPVDQHLTRPRRSWPGVPVRHQARTERLRPSTINHRVARQ